MAKSCKLCVNPYNKTDYQRLKETQRKLADLIPLMDKIERCGVECETFRAVGKELQDRLTAIEREFMTPVPRD